MDPAGFRWRLPADGIRRAGGAALDGPPAPAACVVTGTVPECSATGLTNGTTYYFRVAAANAAGVGDWSAASDGVTPSTVPGAPTSVTGTAGAQVVNVSWIAPADDGGANITGYVVEVATSLTGPFAPAAGCPTSSVATACVATGLTNGTAYHFRVAAVNARGSGSFSSVSAAAVR